MSRLFSKEQDAIIIEMWKDHTAHEIAVELDFSARQICSRIEELKKKTRKIKRKNRKPLPKSNSLSGYTSNEIKKAIAKYYCITVDQLTGKCREQPLARARKMCCYFLFVLKGLGREAVGDELNYKNHSTVSNQARAIFEELDVHRETKLEISNIKLKMNKQVRPAPRVYVGITTQQQARI